MVLCSFQISSDRHDRALLLRLEEVKVLLGMDRATERDLGLPKYCRGSVQRRAEGSRNYSDDAN